MKSAYELAMERLEKEKPSGPPLTEEQINKISEINEKCDAEIAQVKIMADQQTFSAQGDLQAIEQIKANLAAEIQKIEENREYKKQTVREGKE